MEKYLFWGAFFFAYLINGITGFAGNIFAMPVGMSTIGHETSIAVLNCTGLLASIMIAATSFKHIVWREVVKMCSIMLVFMCVGAWINTIAPLDFLQKIYGVSYTGSSRGKYTADLYTILSGRERVFRCDYQKGVNGKRVELL